MNQHISPNAIVVAIIGVVAAAWIGVRHHSTPGALVVAAVALLAAWAVNRARGGR